MCVGSLLEEEKSFDITVVSNDTLEYPNRVRQLIQVLEEKRHHESSVNGKVWWNKQRECFLVHCMRPDGASCMKSAKTVAECTTIMESESMCAIADGDTACEESVGAMQVAGDRANTE